MSGYMFNFGSPSTTFIVSRLTVMTRRKRSSGCLGLFMVLVAQKSALLMETQAVALTA